MSSGKPKKRIAPTLISAVSKPVEPTVSENLLDELKGVVRTLGNSAARQAGLIGVDGETIREMQTEEALGQKFGSKSKGQKRQDHETQMAIHKALKSKGKKYKKSQDIEDSSFLEKRKAIEKRAERVRTDRERQDENRKMIARRMLEDKLTREGHQQMASLYAPQLPAPAWAPSLPTLDDLKRDRDLLQAERKIKGNTGESALALMEAEDKVKSMSPSLKVAKKKCVLSPYSRLRKDEIIERLVDHLPLSAMISKNKMQSMTVKELRKVASNFCYK